MKRTLAQLVAVAAIGTVIAIPGPAHAEDCVTVPVGSSGFTLEAGGQQVRIPAIQSASVCYDLAGLPGVPWVLTEYGGASVVITGGSSDPGHVTFRYVADGATNNVGIPIPSGGGGGSETCLVGVGSPYARPDCAVKLHADQLVPSPLPTVPPASPPPTPEVDPTPACIKPNVCLPQGGTIWEGVKEFLQSLGDRIPDLNDPPQCQIKPLQCDF